MNVLFLDYDGVVNIPAVIEENGKQKIGFNWPDDNCVNNPMAVKFIEYFCRTYHYKIVVSSSWRRYDNYKDCLYNAGLSKEIEILDRTSIEGYMSRADRIYEWINNHKVDKYIVVDDDIVPEDEDMEKHFVQTDCSIGFLLNSFEQAVKIHFDMKSGIICDLKHDKEDM